MGCFLRVGVGVGGGFGVCERLFVEFVTAFGAIGMGN